MTSSEALARGWTRPGWNRRGGCGVDGHGADGEQLVTVVPGDDVMISGGRAEVGPSTTFERSQWSDDATIRVYLARRTGDRGAVDARQLPVGAAVWVVDVSNAGLPRTGEEPGTVERVLLLYDTDTGESVGYFESATTAG